MAARRQRERILTFILVPVIVVAVLVLDGITFRNSFQLEKLREQSVVEATLLLANEKADRLEKRIIEQDNAVASAIDLNERADFGIDWLTSAPLSTPTVRAVLLLDLSSQKREVIAFASRSPGPEDDAFRQLLVADTLDDMKLGERAKPELRHLHKSYDLQNYLLSYWEREIRGRRYLVVVWHDVGAIIHNVFPALYGGSDAQSRVNIVDAEGRILFGPPLSRGRLTLGRQFETTLYKWRLNVTMISAEELAAAVSRRRLLEMVMVGLSGLVVIAGLVVILMAAARERKLSNLKSDFVANVSHELKTPLSLVRMFAELLSSGRVDSDRKREQYLGIIVSEAERLGALIENVLDFAKVERGKASYEFVDSALGEVVARAVEACRVRAVRDDVALELNVADDLPPARVDERAVEVAVINLVDNALKYARDGKLVTVDVGRRGSHLAVAVSDRGPGIPEEERKRIFERFVRSRAASAKQIRGSGIGLALVLHTAESHGGKAWVEAPPEGGSRFIFTLLALPDRREA